MAESVVAPVIDKLVRLLVEEAAIFKGVHRDVQILKEELETIHCFVKDAEAKSERGEKSEAVEAWLKYVTEEAKRIEDVIDLYVRHVTPRRHDESGFLGYLNKIGRSVIRLKARKDIASQVQDFTTSLREMKKRSLSYGLRSLTRDSMDEGSSGQSTHDEQYDPRLDSLLIKEDEIVGIDSTQKELIRMLVEGASSRTVISLVGEGGVGKTTLAKVVYQNAVIVEHFNCHAWITVSESHDLQKLLKTLTKRIVKDAEFAEGEADTIELSIDYLRQNLKTQRYMVVFDDVWHTDFWEAIKHALPVNGKGSRIIITTRNASVAASCKESWSDPIQELKSFSNEVAWELFCKKAFRGSDCPKELEELSRRIVAQCQGLPLVIVAVASFLSRKEKIVLEWLRFLGNPNSALQKHNPELTILSKIFPVTYNDLPYHLKSCFLCFGIFPEDYSIADTRLYKMWIAEGFVKPRRDTTLEEIAREYLEELIHRNLVQVSHLEHHEYDRMCKVHDIMREIILLKADEIGFCQTLNESNPRVGRYRRLSINRGTENVQEIVEDSGVRAIFTFDTAELKKSSMITLFEKCKLLTLLDFENAPLEDLPAELGNLFHLKYLSLKNTKVKKLPKSVRKLQNLQTLDLRNSLLIELPIEINMLHNLRHLLAGGDDDKISPNSTQGVRIKGGFGSLENLQTLVTVDSHLSGIALIRILDKLRQLRRLGISRLTAEVASALSGFITQMNHLETLSLYSANTHEILDLQNISSPPPFLQCLVLKGRIQKLPDWFSRLQNLRRLCLSFSGFRTDPLEYLCYLPNLLCLWLYQAYDGQKLHFGEGCFQKLKLLVLRELHGLEVVEIDKGALPLLEELRIGSSLALNDFTSGVQYLSNLKVLAYYDMPSEFVLSMQPDGGSNYVKVQHIPSVHFWYRVEGRRYVLYQLGEPELLDRLQGSASNIDDTAQREVRLSFSYSDDEEDFASTLNDFNRLSFCSSRVSVYSDDFVE